MKYGNSSNPNIRSNSQMSNNSNKLIDFAKTNLNNSIKTNLLSREKAFSPNIFVNTTKSTTISASKFIVKNLSQTNKDELNTSKGNGLNLNSNSNTLTLNSTTNCRSKSDLKSSSILPPSNISSTIQNTPIKIKIMSVKQSDNKSQSKPPTIKLPEEQIDSTTLLSNLSFKVLDFLNSLLKLQNSIAKKDENREELKKQFANKKKELSVLTKSVNDKDKGKANTPIEVNLHCLSSKVTEFLKSLSKLQNAISNKEEDRELMKKQFEVNKKELHSLAKQLNQIAVPKSTTKNDSGLKNLSYKVLDFLGTLFKVQNAIAKKDENREELKKQFETKKKDLHSCAKLIYKSSNTSYNLNQPSETKNKVLKIENSANLDFLNNNNNIHVFKPSLNFNWESNLVKTSNNQIFYLAKKPELTPIKLNRVNSISFKFISTLNLKEKIENLNEKIQKLESEKEELRITHESFINKYNKIQKAKISNLKTEINQNFSFFSKNNLEKALNKVNEQNLSFLSSLDNHNNLIKVQKKLNEVESQKEYYKQTLEKISKNHIDKVTNLISQHNIQLTYDYSDIKINTTIDNSTNFSIHCDPNSKQNFEDLQSKIKELERENKNLLLTNSTNNIQWDLQPELSLSFSLVIKSIGSVISKVTTEHNIEFISENKNAKKIFELENYIKNIDELNLNLKKAISNYNNNKLKYETQSIIVFSLNSLTNKIISKIEKEKITCFEFFGNKEIYENLLLKFQELEKERDELKQIGESLIEKCSKKDQELENTKYQNEKLTKQKKELAESLTQKLKQNLAESKEKTKTETPIQTVTNGSSTQQPSVPIENYKKMIEELVKVEQKHETLLKKYEKLKKEHDEIKVKYDSKLY